MENIRNIFFYGNYAKEFIKEQRFPIQKKIKFVFDLIRYESRVSKQFLKHIEGAKGLYEIRIEADGDIVRIFCCFDDGQLIVLFNGFQKKTRKTPTKEIQKALLLMEEYFTNKR